MVEEKQHYFMVIAIVAIVAIVALVMMVHGKNSRAASAAYTGSEENLAGQGIAAYSKWEGDQAVLPIMSCSEFCDRICGEDTTCWHNCYDKACVPRD